MWRPTTDEIRRLYEQHAKHLEADHWGKFLALASDGRYLVGDDDLALVEEALKVFGQGNFVLLRVGTIYADIIRHLPQRVVSTNYPYLEVAWSVRHLARQDLAYADTGFEGGFTVPSTYADLLGIEDMQTTVRTADGQEYQVATYLGQLTIVGIDEPLRVRFLTLGDEFLLGRRVLDRYRVTFDRGQQVIVER
jgi:predicted aspartyl protease